MIKYKISSFTGVSHGIEDGILSPGLRSLTQHKELLYVTPLFIILYILKKLRQVPLMTKKSVQAHTHVHTHLSILSPSRILAYVGVQYVKGGGAVLRFKCRSEKGNMDKKAKM